MEQMMERLLAKIDAILDPNQANMAEIRINQEKINASQEWTIVNMDAWLEEMKAF
jgi:hypothetical protein